MQDSKQLSLELASIKAKRDRLNNEATDWAEKRDSFHEKIRELREKASNIKEKRDVLNQKVKELKNLREQAKAKRQENRNEIRRIREKIGNLLERKPSQNWSAIQRKIESLEWKIQTTTLTIEQEEELISQVRRLEIQQMILKRFQELKDRLIEAQAEEGARATEAKSHHEKLSELAEKSQKLHEQRLEILDHVKDLRVEADHTHQKYVETQRKAKEIHQRFEELSQRINDLRQKQRSQEEAKQAKRQKQLLEETRKRALKKMKHGEKLTWEEFKLLMEKETRDKESSPKQKFKEE